MSMIPIVPEKPRMAKSDLLIVLGVVLMLCLCVTVITGFLGLSVWQMKRTQNLAATAATQTVQARSVQATATHIARANDRLGFEFVDPFNDNSNGWYTEKLDDEHMTADIKIANGVYSWTIDEAKKGFAYWGEKNGGLNFLKDFDVYVDARHTQGDSDELCYGLEFRVLEIEHSENYYAYFVCDNGYFGIYYYGGESAGWTTLRMLTKSDAIRPNEWNLLGVSARGSHFTFTINDWRVEEFEDERLKTGQVRVAVSVSEGQSGSIWFDNFALQPK